MVFLTKFATTHEFVLPELNRQAHDDNITSSILDLAYLDIEQTQTPTIVHFSYSVDPPNSSTNNNSSNNSNNNSDNNSDNNNDFPCTKRYISSMRKRQSPTQRLRHKFR